MIRFVKIVGLLFVTAAPLRAQLMIDEDLSFAWLENVGWSNWSPLESLPVILQETYLGGFVWTENAGWINLGDATPTDGEHYANLNGADFGVNIDPVTGNLFGMAWGENVGWLNFQTESLGVDRARLDSDAGRFRGYVWGENIGWLNLNDETHFVAITGDAECNDADFDRDNDVDLADFVQFQLCFTGPGGTATTDCECGDADDDGDVDLADFGLFQLLFTGPA